MADTEIATTIEVMEEAGGLDGVAAEAGVGVAASGLQDSVPAEVRAHRVQEQPRDLVGPDVVKNLKTSLCVI